MTLFAVGLLGATTGHGQAPSPYAGEEARPIKALSERERTAYLDGAGLGQARAAELNGYPGPKHVLELAGELALDDEQRRETQAIFERMRERARALGRRLVDAEAALDERFAAGDLDAHELNRLAAAIGRLQGELRAVHLAAHLEQRGVLSDIQIERYQALRGYHGGHHPGHNLRQHSGHGGSNPASRTRDEPDAQGDGRAPRL